jgi:hypothetical protein
MNDAVLRDIDARFRRIEARLFPPPKPKKRWRNIDPKFRHILRQSMQEKGLSQTDLAVLMFGPRKINSEGKNVPKGKDRISEWLSGKAYPSPANMAKLAQFVDVV